jgi:hypothetical protein
MKTLKRLALAVILISLPVALSARTKLVTLPDRDAMVMSLENPTATLLYEEREIPLQQGANSIDFSWSGVSIDTDSVMIEMLSHPGTGDEATKVIATGFPPNENALTWLVASPEARTERIRVSYLLRGIAQETSYEIRVNEDETGGDFRQYLLLKNGSGEDLDNTVVRLPQMDDLTRSVDSGEVRRFLANRQNDLPIKKLYVATPSRHQYMGEEGEHISLVYQIENTAEKGLGEYKLSQGKVRLFGDDGMDSSIFLGEDMMSVTPPGEEADLSLGKVQDVVLERFREEYKQEDIRKNDSGRAVLFNIDYKIRYEVENSKDEAVTLKIEEALEGEWEIDQEAPDGVRFEKKSINMLEVYIDLPARNEDGTVDKKTVYLDLTLKNRFPNEFH